MIRKITAAILLALVALCAVVYWSYGAVVVRVPVAGNVVALTYDDGPNPPFTGDLLGMLEKHGVQATFFLKGRNVDAFPDAVRAVAAAGHEIGNHSYDHQPMISFSESAMRAELTRTNRAISNVLGYKPELFRPPYGIQGPGLKMALEELGMLSILMTDSGADWEVSDPALIASAVLKTVEPGSIILLHDGHGDVDDPHTQDSRTASVAATGMIIEELHSRGYQFVTVGALMGMSGE